MVYLAIIGSSVLCWLGLFGFFLIAKEWPRAWFSAAHLVWVALLFLLIYGAFFKLYRGVVPVYQVVALGMATIFAIEAIVYLFLYKGELWFLNWVDWILPVFLAASIIYFLGQGK